MAENISILSEQNFDKEVIKSDVPVLVDFWAQWCGPCKALAPTLDEIAKETLGKFKIAKVDVSEHAQLATDFKVVSIPTIILFKSGREVGRLVGIVPKAKLIKRLEALI